MEDNLKTYKLTLTYADRMAIDWVGDRYSNGTELYRLLWIETPDECQSAEMPLEQIEDGVQWDGNYSITFDVPEQIAWKIKDNEEQEDSSWSCFADELRLKMERFIDSLVQCR